MPNYDSHGNTTSSSSSSPSPSTSSATNNCRTCSDFKFWSKQQRQVFHNAANEKNVTYDASRNETKNNNAAHSSNNSSTASRSSSCESSISSTRNFGYTSLGRECPLDKNKLGRYTWGLLHTMAAFYSDSPTESDKKDVKQFFTILARIYPCEYCARDFQKDLQENPINANTQEEFSQWLCNFHNRVNQKLGKPLFDCSKVDERWRDGWLDGSCD